MSRSNYDEAYEAECRRYPSFMRMTPTNMKILIAFVALYAIANITIGVIAYIQTKNALNSLSALYSSGSYTTSSYLTGFSTRIPGAVLAYSIGSVVINLVITWFVINVLLGNVNDYFQVYCMVGIPIWAALILIYSRTIPNLAFMLPLFWMWLMIIIEKKIHVDAQRRANNLDALERDHRNREGMSAYSRANAAIAAGSDEPDDSIPDYGPIKGRDAKYCPVCGIELGPNDTECPMCSPMN